MSLQPLGLDYCTHEVLVLFGKVLCELQKSSGPKESPPQPHFTERYFSLQWNHRTVLIAEQRPNNQWCVSCHPCLQEGLVVFTAVSFRKELGC